MFSRSRDARGPTRHPFPPHGPSPSSYSLLPLSSSSLAASYSPARVSFAHAGPSRRAPRSRSLRPAPVRDGEASTVRCRTQTKTHERVRGHLALADRHRGRFLLPFPLHRSSHPALFSSSATFLRRGARASARSFLPHLRLLLPFRMPPRESDFSPSSSPPASAVFLSSLSLLSPLSSLREESTSAKVDRLYPVNQVAS